MPSSYNKIPYNSNKDLLDELETYYSYVLDSSMLNYKDPIAANIGYFNNLGKVWVDGPKLGRTMVFITRPNMNFKEKINITKCRAFNYLTSSRLGVTLARMLQYCSCAGDINYGGYPDFSYKNLGILVGSSTDEYVGGDHVAGVSSGNDYSFPLDNSNFMTLLTNTCTETSNAKDLILDVDETEGDYSGNKLVYGAGMDDTMGPGEITLSFDDLYGSPVLNLMILWVYYIHYVTKGFCNPEYNYVVNRIIDYTCSIYVFMLDTDQKTIIRWIKYGGCFPKSIPFGQILHTKEPNLQALSQIQIPFQYNFACPMDPMVLSEFNMIAEPELAARKNRLNSEETAFSFFKGKNHSITEEQSLVFMDEYPPPYPDKMFNPTNKSESERATNTVEASPIRLYTDSAGDPPINKVSANSGMEDGVQYFQNTTGLRMVNRYYGMTSTIRNSGHPYIVGGNKLVFI